MLQVFAEFVQTTFTAVNSILLLILRIDEVLLALKQLLCRLHCNIYSPSTDIYLRTYTGLTGAWREVEDCLSGYQTLEGQD